MPEFESTPLPHDAPQINGAAMRAVAERIRSEHQRVQASGLLQPWTIVNFNPVEVGVECALIRFKIPAAGKSQKSVTIAHGVRKCVGSYVTIREAIVRPKLRNVSRPEGADDPIAEYEPLTILPVEQAFLFWQDYHNADNPMGGVLCFEGDIHVLRRKADKLHVPSFVTLADRSRQYLGVEIPLVEAIEDVMRMQRAYCDFTLSSAHSMANDEEQARNITNIHRTWADFALRLGWIQQIPEWVFASTDQRDICPACGAAKKHPSALKCQGCGRPYDAFAAYMAGEDVPLSYLVTLPEEKLKQIRDEQVRRKKVEQELLRKD